MSTGAGRARDVATARKGYSRHNHVRSLQRTLYRAAKQDRRRAFHALYQHLWREDVLWESWRRVRSNGGSGGVDGVNIKAFEAVAHEELKNIADELRNRTYRAAPIRRVYIPKPNGEERPLGIPTIRDRVVQGAIVLVLEPILEARAYEHSYGFRPRRSAHDAVNMVRRMVLGGYEKVLDLDIRKFFDSVPHSKLLSTLRQHTADGPLLGLIKRALKAPVMEPNGVLHASRIGCPQGGPLSPILANAYLSILDFWFTKKTSYRDLVWIRYADDGVVVSRRPLGDLRQRIEHVLSRMGLKVHPDKTHEVDLGAVGGTIDFLGFRIARRRAQTTARRALLFYPTPKACAGVREKLRGVVPTRGGQLPDQVARRANRVLRGWVQYFRLSNRREPFRALDRYVHDRMRHFMMRRRGLRHRGTRKYPDGWLRERLGLLSPYIEYVKLRTRANADGRRTRESRVRE